MAQATLTRRSVTDPKRPAMAMTSPSEFGVFGAAAGIALRSDTRPMLDGVGEAIMVGPSSDDDAALSGPLGDGRDSCQTTQGGVITSLQGMRRRFQGQRGVPSTRGTSRAAPPSPRVASQQR